MCGITGIRSFTAEGKKSLYHCGTAAYSLLHRGPDHDGIIFENEFALGHRRLSIIDTSKKAAQPMRDASDRYLIVFNGEIFNYKTLRKELESKGIKFYSESDTEVLLYLFIQEKEKCLEKLDGEFAFAVYDKKKGDLFLARDRFGIKPLYYFMDEDKFIFASELKSLLAYQIPKVIDEASLEMYLHLNYIPSPYSIFKNVKKLEAGCYAKIANCNLQISNYYRTDPNPLIPVPKYSAATAKLHDLLVSSVHNRMIADVPFGTFLSGGVDSSIVSAIAARQTKNLRSFSIGFKDEKFFDETSYAQLVAKRIKTEHTVFSLSNQDLFTDLHSVLDSIDEPFADSSSLAVFILSKHTRKKVKVALSGDGADELFGGYTKHAAELKARRGGLATNILKKSRSVLKTLPGSRNSKLGNKIRQLKKFSEGMNLSEKERYWRWAGFASDKDLTSLLRSVKGHPESETRKAAFLSAINDNYNSILLTDIKLVLENDMLVKVDRMSMANSLELRVPFLDHKIVDFVFSLPAQFKINSNRQKKILKDAFADYLPEEIYNRKKQGFEVPLLKWFRTELKGMITDDLLNEQFIKEQSIFNYSEVKIILDRLFSTDPGDSVARIWGLVVFQYWWKKNMNA